MSRGTPEAFSGTGTVGPRRDGLAAVLLRCYIRYSLGELPSMACQILHGAVPLAVLAICGCFEHPCSVRTCALELGIDIFDPDTDEVCYLIAMCRLLSPALGDDRCAIGTDAHLRAVTLAYSSALNEAERCAQPGHRGPHVRIGKYGHDGGWRYRPVDLHLPTLPYLVRRRQRRTASSTSRSSPFGADGRSRPRRGQVRQRQGVGPTPGRPRGPGCCHRLGTVRGRSGCAFAPPHRVAGECATECTRGGTPGAR